jgi:hypothetical protein
MYLRDQVLNTDTWIFEIINNLPENYLGTNFGSFQNEDLEL